MTTTAEQLVSVRAAIAAVESGTQETRLPDGRVVRYPELEVLYAREKDLLARMYQEARPPGRITIGLGAGS
jgi:hypothetical protein